ncbi:hypothetical protein [Streptomyces lichenis]|uniref:hypothetical protein n=1 Tax=Streptomyces lichenis TaxID=2306967 RepID=UPI00355702C2
MAATFAAPRTEWTGRSPAETSVAAVVRRAEVGRAAFSLHCPDLEALAVDACAEVVSEAVEALRAWRGVPSPARRPNR